MKKVTKLKIVGIAVIVFFYLISIYLGVIANVRLDKLSNTNEHNKEIQSEVEKSKEFKISEDEYTKFISVIFEPDGRIYVDKNQNTFYEDAECEKKIANSKDIRFLSKDGVLGRNKHNQLVSCYLTENNKVVYCLSSYPVNLEEER